MKTRELASSFASPGSEYRGAPFWAWNGTLEPDELRRQIRIMHRMGLGGFFMHSRVGLNTAYLSDRWFECVEACIDEAERLDMQAWLYDEDRWPSGAAGGLVTRDPGHRQRFLVLRTHERAADYRPAKDDLAAFTARVDRERAADVVRLPAGRRPRRLPAGHRILVFRVETPALSSWYNGYTYLDTLSPDAVDAFIASTHEVYRQRCGRHFGRRVPGIFTDEPNYGHGHQCPWTDRLPRVFRARYGYDVRRHLPELFFEVDGEPYSRARHHYHDCIAHLFVDAFARRIGAWCERHGLQHTGHVLMEDSLSSQTAAAGACMRFYEYMQAPGMDLLTEHWRVYDVAKQVSSAARQFGRRWRLTETYGCTGWDFPFLGHKALGDWQVAMGINLRCQHLSWYTMAGQAKRDYPAGIFYQSPWWEAYGKVEDYFARVLSVMTRGEEVRDILVVHPVESVWGYFRRGAKAQDGAVGRMDRAIRDLRDALLEANLDFDYGDEDILARHGRVSRTARGPVLKVARAAYRVAVVPPMETIRASTLALLHRFAAAGGTVVFAGDPAPRVDAVASAAASELAAACVRAPASGPGLARRVEGRGRRVSICDAAGRAVPTALYLLREDREAAYLFVCNTGHTAAQLRRRAFMDDVLARDRTRGYEDVRIAGFAGFAGQPLELDPETGRMAAAKATGDAGGWTVQTGLPALGSRLFVFPRKARAGRRLPPPVRWQDARRRALAPSRWTATLDDPNVVALDRPAWRIDGGEWQPSEEILRVDAAVRDHLGVPRRGGQMVQPWAREAPAQPRAVAVTLDYTLDVEVPPSGALLLGLERPDTFDVFVNGVQISPEAECGWWCDRSLRTLPVAASLLRAGRNTLRLQCRFSELHPGLEIVYLLGAFGVELRGRQPVLTAPPSALRLGDWVPQGLPFYGGSVTYTASVAARAARGERVCVRIPAYRGVAVRVFVDGRNAGIAAWDPHEVDITDLLPRKGRAAIGIQVMGHRRNSHGPLHLSVKWPVWTGPGEFTTCGDKWTDDYQLVPCGLMKPPELVWRRKA